MKIIYIINQTVRFDPQAHSLAPVGRQELEIVLHTPASQCLLLLLRNNGKTVSKKFLSEEIWEKNGAFVATNTLYQNIASVRKALKASGIQEDILKTMPKVGFQIMARVEEREELLYPVEEKVEEKIEIAPETAPKNNDELVIPEPQEVESLVEIPRPATGKKNRKLLYMVGGLFFLTSCIMLYQQLSITSSFFADYYHVGKVNGCELYSSFFDNKRNTEDFTLFSQKISLKCQPEEIAYMTFNRAQRFSSFFVCNKSIELKNAQCMSYVHTEASNEK